MATSSLTAAAKELEELLSTVDASEGSLLIFFSSKPRWRSTAGFGFSASVSVLHRWPRDKGSMF
jgi:hypothetical protein